MKDENLLSSITKALLRRDPKMAAFFDRHDKIMLDLDKKQMDEKRKRELEKSKRLINYYERFTNKFETTVLEEREALIKANEGHLGKKRIKAKMQGQNSMVGEYDEMLSMIKGFYEIIDTLPYVKLDDNSYDKESNKLSFDLISEASSGLNNLRKILIEKKLINEVEPNAFKSVFYAGLETKAVDWKIKGEMKYFVQQFCKKEEIFRSSPDNYYVIASACFTVAGKVVSNKELGGIHLTKNMKSRRIIDKAIKDLLITSGISVG